VTLLGAFSKHWHTILKFNLLLCCGHHYYLSQHFNVLNLDDSVFLFSKYYRILVGRCPEEPPLITICNGDLVYSV